MDDSERRRGLRRMKRVALGALLAMAVVFVVAFAFQSRMPWLAYVRAAAEGGMVGALADWFAVTALFRHPLRIPIPHTAIIPRRKNEIGRSLSDFVASNFLSPEVVRDKLRGAAVARRLGTWLAEPAHAERAVASLSAVAASAVSALSDDDVRDLLAEVAKEHVLDPEWGPPLGARLAAIVSSEALHGAVDLAATHLATWLASNPHAFDGLVSRRLPAWVPSLAHRLVDETVYREALAFVAAVRDDPAHPARAAIDEYLARLADGLQHDATTIERLERAKARVFDSPRVRTLATDAWSSAKSGLLAALADPDSALRRRATSAAARIGERIADDEALQERIDDAIAAAAAAVVSRHGTEIAGVISETVERWDPAETTAKLELLVGRDLQYIRINGTIVGALAGLAIFSVADGIRALVGG